MLQFLEMIQTPRIREMHDLMSGRGNHHWPHRARAAHQLQGRVCAMRWSGQLDGEAGLKAQLAGLNIRG